MSERLPEVGGATFWNRFVRTTWGQRPRAFQDFAGGRVFTAAHLFDALTVASHRVRRREKHVHLRFYGDGYNMQVLEDFERYLPVERDGDLKTWARRVGRALGHSNWGIALNHLQLYSPQLWRRAREVAHALVSRIGLPGGIVSIESFIGPYRSTSFGIHKDQFHVFTFPVVGEKTTRLWPYEALSKRLGLPDDADEALEVINTPYRTALPDARPPITLRAREGGMTYWPPQYWHIATGRGALAATVIVSVSAKAPAIELVRKVAPKPKGRLEPVKPSASQVHVRALQAEARAQARALSSTKVTAKLRDEVDKRVSATGFEPVVEPLASEPVSPTTVLEMDARFPIVTRRRGDTLDCFMNGHAISVTPAHAMAKLFALLNRGGRFEAATLCRMTADWLLHEGYEPDDQYVLEVLSAGVSFRTLTKANAST